MNKQEALDEIESWIEESTDEGYCDFKIKNKIDTITIIINI